MEQFKILAPKEKRLLLQEEHGSLLEKEDIIGHITFNDLISHLYSYKTQKASPYIEKEIGRILGLKRSFAKKSGDYIDKNGKIIEFKYSIIDYNQDNLRGVQFRINHLNINEYILLEINAIDTIKIRAFVVPANIIHNLVKQFGKNSHNNNSNEKALTFKPNIIQKYLTIISKIHIIRFH